MYVFMHEQSNSEIEIKLKIPPLNLHFICYYFCIIRMCLQLANIKKAKHKVTSRKKIAKRVEVVQLKVQVTT